MQKKKRLLSDENNIHFKYVKNTYILMNIITILKYVKMIIFWWK